MKWLSAVVHLVSGSDPTNPTPEAGMEYFNSTNSIKRVHNGTSWLYANEFALPFTIQGTLSVGVTGRKQRLYNRSGSPWYIIGADLYLNTGAAGGIGTTFQVNRNGSSAFAVSVTGQTATGTPNYVVNSGDYLDVDVTGVGSTTAGADATLTLSIAS